MIPKRPSSSIKGNVFQVPFRPFRPFRPLLLVLVLDVGCRLSTPDISGILSEAFVLLPPRKIARDCQVDISKSRGRYWFSFTGTANVPDPFSLHSQATPGQTSDRPEGSSLPPVAEREEWRYVTLGGKSSDGHQPFWMDPPVNISDPYGWMRVDLSVSNNHTPQQQQRVLDYIEQLNQYTDNIFYRQENRTRLQQELVQDYQSLVETTHQEDSSSAGLTGDISQLYLWNGYHYYAKRLGNQPYPIHCRKLANHSASSQEELLLDENELAKTLGTPLGSGYFAVHSVVPIASTLGDNTTGLIGVAFSVDLTGDESYQIYVQDYSNADGRPLPSGPIRLVDKGTSGTIEVVVNFHQESFVDYSIHYIRMEPALARPFQWIECKLDSHTLVPGNYTILHTEPDEKLWGDLSQTSDGRFLVWRSESSASKVGNLMALDLKHSSSSHRPFRLQVPFTKYKSDHRMDHWWVLNTEISNTSLSTTNQQIFTSVQVDASVLTPENIPLGAFGASSSRVSLDHLTTFSNHVVVQGRQDGIQRIWALNIADKREEVENVYQLFEETTDEAAHYVTLARRQDYDSNICVLTFESMATPPQILQVNLAMTGHHQSAEIVHEKRIAGYNRSDFSCHRLLVPSRDGTTLIPTSLVHHKEAHFPCPIHLFGYGAYGHSLEPAFSTTRIPLLRRGVACAVAHVRGGGELGPQWHYEGKGALKVNSINDFCDVATWLVEQNRTRSDLLAAEGRSAGGLLVAGAMNQNPHLFRCVVLGVPFLDILCTMADESLPLTALEWDEWGNPQTLDGFNSIRGYAPMHNIATNKTYPSCLLIGGLKDPRVPYWEPLKFAAALQHETQQSEERPVLVKIDTNAGHSFGSNRTKYFEQIAFLYAFVLDQIK